MTRYGKGTAINLTRITAPDQINVINDNFRKIQTQLMGVKNYLEPIAQAGKEASDRLNQYLGSDPPVSHPQMVNYAQKQIAMGPTPPDEPDVGDVWFVTDDSGNVIAIRHWDGTQWVDDVDNVAVQQAIDEANQAAANAQQVGQQAQQTAEQATQAAQAAQEAADAATQAANNAQADADDAKTQAQSAVDTANQLAQTTDALQSRMTDAENNISEITQTTQSLSTQISAKADTDWVTSQFTQLSNDINLRVSKDDIINQINLSTEGILIDGAKVHITGQTTIDNAVITDAMIASLSASKLTAGTIDASVITVKNINASNIVTGTLDASKVTVANIDASKINTGTLNAARIAAGSIDASKLSVTSLSAISANLGNVTAGTITGVTINGGTMIGTNLIVNDGDVIFRDSVTQSQYSLIPRNNMLDDHSFELMKTSGSVGSDGYFAVSVDSMGMSGGWYVTGSPKLSSAYNTDIIPDAIFGRQAVLVNSSNYVEQILDIGYLKENRQYTISVYARRPNNYTAGIPKIYIYSFYDNARTNVTTWSTTYTASTAPPSDYSIVRYTYTFTMPSRSTTGSAEVVGIRLLGSNSNWVMLDGVQLVEGSRSSIYFDESSLWGIRRLPTSFYEPIIAEKFVYTDAIENNLNGNGVNIYIRPKNELRVTSPGSTTSYLPLRASNVYTNSVDINDLTSGVNMYIRPKSGGEVRATETGTTTTYAPMRAKEYNPPNSLREMKKNIEEFTDDVLDTFRNIKTYTFNYNFEEDGAKKTLGLMLDEAPEILWNTSGDSINMYSSIGYLFTGLKQTVAKLDEYKDAIENLEERLTVLENKMS